MDNTNVLTCPRCMQSLELEGDPGYWAGRQVECPTCGSKIAVPQDHVPAENHNVLTSCDTSSIAHITAFATRFRWLLCGSAVATFLVLWCIVASIEAQNDCNRAVAAATSSASLDAAIEILQSTLQKYSGRRSSLGVQQLLDQKVAERQRVRDAAAINTAIDSSRLLAARRKYDEALAALSACVNRHPCAPNIVEARKLVEQYQRHSDDYQPVACLVTNNSSAILTTLDKACLGDTESEYRLGLALLNGTDVTPDRAQGCKWLDRAAKRDHVEALYSRGLCYILDKHDVEKAFPLFAKAAKAGHMRATHFVGMSYLFGKGVPADVDKGCAFLKESASKGDSASQLVLGKHLLDTDPTEALKWIDRAAQQDEPEAQIILFRSLISGKGVAKNPAKALDILTECADGGDPEAIALLIKCHLGDFGFPRDVARTVSCIDKYTTLTGKDAKSSQDLKKRVLAEHAKATFATYNDPQFSQDKELALVANRMAHFNLNYPSVAECRTLIANCASIAVSTNSDTIKLAALGSRYIFEYEIEMADKGFHRWGAYFLTATQLKEVQQRAAQRQSDVEEYLKQQNAEVKQVTYVDVPCPSCGGRGYRDGLRRASGDPFRQSCITCRGRRTVRSAGGSRAARTGSGGTETIEMFPAGTFPEWRGYGGGSVVGAGEFGKIMPF